MDVMKARFYKDKDFKMVSKWWAEAKIPVDNFSKILLSDTGIIISNKGKDICACWLYVGNTDVAQLGWFISNKNSEQKDRGLKYLIKISSRYLKTKGYKLLMIYNNNSNMIKRLKEMNYIEADLNIKQMIKKL